MRILCNPAILAGVAAAALAAAPACASVNLDFETGTMEGWTSNVPAGDAAYTATAGVSSEQFGFTPQEGSSYLAYITPGLGDGAYTTMSQSFHLAANGTISGLAAFLGREFPDIVDHNDNAYVKIFGGSLPAEGEDVFYSDIAQVGLTGMSGTEDSGGWVPFSYSADVEGIYTLVFGIANDGDNELPSAAVIDQIHVTGEILPSPAPEAATWAMMLAGFGLVGAAMRRRRSVVRFG